MVLLFAVLLNIWKSLLSSASVERSVTVFHFMGTQQYQQIITSVRGEEHTLSV